MRTQTVNALSDGREWLARPVDPTGWLAAPSAGAGDGNGEDRATAPAATSGRRAVDCDGGSATVAGERAARRARVRRRRRGTARVLSGPAKQTYARRRAAQGAAERVSAASDRAAAPVDGYRMGRWARLTLTLTALTAVAVVTLSLTAGSGSTAMVDVTVAPGDTLWSIAARAAPDRDPRGVIDEIRQLNDLPGTVLPVGVVLRVPSSTE